MWMQIGAILGCICLFAFTIRLAAKYGSKQAQLENIKAEIRRQAEEQERANEIMDNVRNFDEHTVRERLHEIANKQR